MNPADAVPLVLETLTKACSQETAVLKPAEQQLQHWETQQGFYSTLLTIFSNHNVAVNVRWLSVLYFKNGVDRYWRKNAPNAICEEEKCTLRKSLLCPDNFREPMTQVATQLAVLVAKIARLDCPRNWPDLVPTLLEGVKCQEEHFQQRILLTLKHVTKALASKRLAPDRKLFEELSANIFNYLMNLWNSFTDSFFQSLDSRDLPLTLNTAENSLLCLKILREMIVHGFKHPERNTDCVLFISLVLQRVELFIECKNKLTEPILLEKREKISLLLTKVLYDMQENHADSYVQFIRKTLDMVVHYNFTTAGDGLIYERFTVSSFNIMKNIIRSENYKPARSVDETTDPLVIEAYKSKMAFFTRDTLTEICRRLISQYFLLTQQDLELWDSGPEDFVNEDGGDSWKFSLRPCTEVLFLSLVKEFREIITPVLVTSIQEIPRNTNPDDLTSILRKDSIYYAAGLASFDLFDEVDFDQWFTEQLLDELKVTHSNYRIIHRRVTWLIGQWIGVKFSPNQRPTLYQALLALLQSQQDLVVRLEASSTLKSAIDDMEFSTEQFLPYLETTYSLLYQLLKDVQECETKMHILNVLSFVIERVGCHIRPYVTSLVQYLPLLWDDSADHKLLRCAILSTLTYLVQGLGVDSMNLHGFLLPVIEYSTDVSDEPHVYLAEDALELWLTTLHNSSKMTEHMLKIYKNMAKLLELSTEMLRTSLKIIESYALLGGNQFVELYFEDLSECLRGVLSDLREEGIVLVMKLIEVILKVLPSDGPKVVFKVLQIILKNVLDGEEYPFVMAMYLTVISRIMFQNPSFFTAFIEYFAQNANLQTGDVLHDLLEIYVDRFDAISQPERRKICALALTSLLSLNMPSVLNNFGGIITVCVECLHDVTNSNDETGEYQDVLVLHEEAKIESDDMETEHTKRKRQLSMLDPVHTLSLKDFLQEKLLQCQNIYGPEIFSQLMGTIDKEIQLQLQAFMK